MARRRNVDVALQSVDEPAIRSAESHRAGDQSVEHGLEIERRTADQLEHVAGRRLLFEGDPQLAVARLQFREEAHVLDGDHGLIGKGLEQVDLLVGEGTRLRASHGNGSGGLSFAKHRYDENAAVPERSGEWNRGRGHSWFGLEV